MFPARAALVLMAVLSLQGQLYAGHGHHQPGAGPPAAVGFDDEVGVFTRGEFAATLSETGEILLVSGVNRLTLDAGFFGSIDGAWTPFFYLDGTHSVDAEGVTWEASLGSTGATVRVRMTADGSRVVLNASLDGADPWARMEWAALHLNLAVRLYSGRRYITDAGEGVYPPELADYEIATGLRWLQASTDRPLTDLRISSPTPLDLVDLRFWGANAYTLEVPFPLDSPYAVRLVITPPADTSEEAPGGIRVSQLGFTPDESKEAYVELDRRTVTPPAVALVRDGSPDVVANELAVEDLGEHWRRRVYRVRFDEVDEAGSYHLESGTLRSEPFPIAAGIYRPAGWAALDVYLPFQMCHTEFFLDGERGHRPCHLDDARQVGPDVDHPDGFVSFGDLDSDLEPDAHVPCAVGGWHDAADYDVNTAEAAFTTWTLATTWIELRPHHDVASHAPAEDRWLWLRGEPDGEDDILQQTAWGARWLLNQIEADGGVTQGVVGPDWPDYGLPEQATDGLVFDPSLGPGEVVNGRSGTPDDRQVYTNTHTLDVDKATAALAAAARALQGYQNGELARDCEAGALALDAYRRTHPETWFDGPAATADPDPGFTRSVALVELYLTTRDALLLDELEALLPALPRSDLRWTSFTRWGRWNPLTSLCRLYPRLAAGRARLAAAIEGMAAGWAAEIAAEEAANPYEVAEHIHQGWGLNQEILGMAYAHWWLARTFDWAADSRNRGLAYLRWLTGAHPGTSHSFVGGVGTLTPQHPYLGIDRVIGYSGEMPGHLVPGLQGWPSVGVVEFADDPESYLQSEGVVGGGAAWLQLMQAYGATPPPRRPNGRVGR